MNGNLVVATAFTIQVMAFAPQSSLAACHEFTRNSSLQIGQKGDACEKNWPNAFCFVSDKILSAMGISNSQLSVCKTKRSTQLTRCSEQTKQNCPKPRGSSETANNAPSLTFPYGKSILEDRPTLQWLGVKGTDKYIVEVFGANVHWRESTTKTSLTYPETQSELQAGHAYRVTTVAYSQNAPIAASKTTLIRIREEDEVQIRESVNQLSLLKLPKDELLLEGIDPIYMGYGLLSETIKTLEGRVTEGTRNPRLHRILGDRYLEAGLPNIAQQKYQRAASLAEVAGNKTELAKARLALSRLVITPDKN